MTTFLFASVCVSGIKVCTRTNPRAPTPHASSWQTACLLAVPDPVLPAPWLCPPIQPIPACRRAVAGAAQTQNPNPSAQDRPDVQN